MLGYPLELSAGGYALRGLPLLSGRLAPLGLIPFYASGDKKQAFFAKKLKKFFILIISGI